MKVHLISLGCAKNLVDSEIVLGSLVEGGWEVTNDENEADVLLLNTCGFIQPAVEEAVEEILELVSVKEKYPEKKIVVMGCLVQRYQSTLLESLPEVDLFYGTEGPTEICTCLDDLMAGRIVDKVIIPETFLMDSSAPRVQTTPFFRAWVKITEGCDNRCSYCMIPAIRGPLRSRYIDDVVQEIKNLEANGVKEISLIAQDLTAFGNDLEDDINLVALLKAIIAETTVPWIRLLYLYPSGLTDDLLKLMVDSPRIVRYLDIPFQHANDKVLKKMNRPYGNKYLVDMITKIRGYLPDIAIRTTFLVGFPGESEADFTELIDFLQSQKLDHVGVFPYCNEEGAPSEHYPEQCSEEEKEYRCTRLLEVQQEISAENQKKYLGTKQMVLVEGVSEETELLLEGRTQYQAADVDGCVYINEGEVVPGDIVEVEITDAQHYDLVGGVVS
ncbi:MAG: 30S ribosomal protein S12 methylthiotransferase RimO [Desulfotalea sp.]